MSERKKNTLDSNDYQRYLAGQMKGKERHDFERKLLEDDFENEAFEGLSQLPSDQISEDLEKLRGNLKSKTRTISSTVFWRVAATLVILCIFSFIIYLTLDFESASEVAQNKDLEASEEQIINDNSEAEDIDVSINERKANEESMEPGRKESVIVQKDEQVIDSKPEASAIAEIADNLMKQEKPLEPHPIEQPTLALSEKLEIEEYTEELTEVDSDILEEEAIKSSTSRASSAAPAALKKIESTTARMEEGVILERTRKISGKVSSIVDVENLSGVEVSVNETSLRTVTDSDGTYTIEIPEDRDALLIYSYPGFESKAVQVVDREIIDVNIEPDPAFVSEIVALGFQDAGENINTSNSYIPPRPVGGSLKFNEYVQENIRYPLPAIDEKIGGTVKLKITVGIYGQISNVEVLKSLGKGFDEEAVRLIVEGPEWEAAVKGDTAVARDVEIKIRFWPPK